MKKFEDMLIEKFLKDKELLQKGLGKDSQFAYMTADYVINTIKEQAKLFGAKSDENRDSQEPKYCEKCSQEQFLKCGEMTSESVRPCNVTEKDAIEQMVEYGSGKEIRSSFQQNIINEVQHSFRCRLKEDCPAYRSKECLRCENYCISYMDLYQVVCLLEDVKELIIGRNVKNE